MTIEKKRSMKLVVGFLVMLFMGVSLAWSVFVVPIEDYFGWSRNQTSLAFTINIIFFAIGSMAVGTLSKYFSIHNMLKAVPFIIASGFLLTSRMTAVWQLYIGFGVLVGGGVGFGYNCILSSVPAWFPEKSATATGTLLMGYALSTAVFGPILNWVIGRVGILTAFQVLAGVCGCSILILGHFIYVPSLDEMGQLPQWDRKSGKKARNIITVDMMKMPLFWVYYVMTILMTGIGNAMINHNSPILTENLGTTAAFAAAIVSIVAICNGVARFCFGFVFDRLGVKVSIIIVSILFLAAICGVYLGISAENRLVYMISVSLILISYGCNATMMPSVIREMFGHRTFSLNYSVLATDAVFSALFPTIVGSLKASSGTYHLPIMVLMGAGILNMGILMVFLKLLVRMEKEN